MLDQLNEISVSSNCTKLFNWQQATHISKRTVLASKISIKEFFLLSQNYRKGWSMKLRRIADFIWQRNCETNKKIRSNQSYQNNTSMNCMNLATEIKKTNENRKRKPSRTFLLFDILTNFLYEIARIIRTGDIKVKWECCSWPYASWRSCTEILIFEIYINPWILRL